MPARGGLSRRSIACSSSVSEREDVPVITGGHPHPASYAFLFSADQFLCSRCIDGIGACDEPLSCVNETAHNDRPRNTVPPTRRVGFDDRVTTGSGTNSTETIPQDPILFRKAGKAVEIGPCGALIRQYCRIVLGHELALAEGERRASVVASAQHFGKSGDTVHHVVVAGPAEKREPTGNTKRGLIS